MFARRGVGFLIPFIDFDFVVFARRNVGFPYSDFFGFARRNLDSPIQFFCVCKMGCWIPYVDCFVFARRKVGFPYSIFSVFARRGNGFPKIKIFLGLQEGMLDLLIQTFLGLQHGMLDSSFTCDVTVCKTECWIPLTFCWVCKTGCWISWMTPLFRFYWCFQDGMWDARIPLHFLLGLHGRMLDSLN